MSDSTYYDGKAVEEAEFAGLYYDAPFDWPEPERGKTRANSRVEEGTFRKESSRSPFLSAALLLRFSRVPRVVSVGAGALTGCPTG